MLDNPYESPPEAPPQVAPAKPTSSVAVWRSVCLTAVGLTPVFWLAFVMLPDKKPLPWDLSLSNRDTIDSFLRVMTMACLITAAVTGSAWLLAAIRARNS